MRKRFNDTGLCIPEKHYMADTSAKVEAILALVESSSYFTINRPRQYGKTTVVHLLSQKLSEKKDYLLIEMSFEGIGDAIFENEERFCVGFTGMLAEEIAFLKENALADYLSLNVPKVTSLKKLSQTITQLCKSTNKKIVLAIDEIDKNSNNQLFLSFLGMLREKYLRRNRLRDFTFQSVLLIGVHDVKTLKFKISPESKSKLNSPWNIAIDFKVEMSFSSAEIQNMLIDYARETKVELDVPELAEKIYYYTSGYPYLVSKLCKFVDEDILPAKSTKSWDIADLEAAFKKITYGGYTTTLFDSLTKILEDDLDLYRMIFDININGASYDFNISAPVINMAAIYGIIKDNNGICQIHNRVFEQRFYDYFLTKQATEKGVITGALKSKFYLEDGLNIPNILLRFQQFMRENYSHRDAVFLEREGRLVFLSFLKPIINGQGFDFKEPNVAAERRMDIVISWKKRRYVLEIKRWEGEAYHQKGLQQLSDYLDTYSLKKGYLLIFDFRKKKKYKKETIHFKDKEIFAIWI